MSPTARVVLGEGAASARRQLGPTSWAALEVFVALSDDDACRVVTSVRDVADELGLSKNAAHRAIRRLVDAGLIAPTQGRATDGRFLAGAYRLDVRLDVLHRTTGVRKLMRQLNDNERERRTVLGANGIGGLTELRDALFHWRCWAEGRPVPADAIVSAVEALQDQRVINSAAVDALLKPLEVWCESRGIQPQRPVIQPAPVEHAPDLGIGL